MTEPAVRPGTIFDDLVSEQDRLEAVLGGLDEAAWLSPSGAAGWTVSDVVLHLAQSDELAAASVRDTPALAEEGVFPRGEDESIDDAVERAVRSDRAAPGVVFERWRRARRDSVEAMRAAEPTRSYPWTATPLRPATLATTRLAEHWAHGLDITEPLGIAFPDTDRLRHVAWLGHRSLPYGFAVAGREPAPVYAELVAPDGVTVWRYGPPDAPSRVTGAAGAFCRVGAQRLAPDRSGLVATGPDGEAALRALRNYAA